MWFADRMELDSVRPLLDRAPVGFAVFDERMRVRYVNPALAAIHGLEPGHIARTIDELFPVHHVELLKPAVTEVLADGAVLRDIEVPVAVNGVDRHLVVNLFPLRDSKNRVVAAVATVHDLTRSHQLVDRVQRFGGTGSWELDLRSGRVEWSTNMCRIAGVPRSPESIDDVMALVHPDDMEVAGTYFASLLTGKPTTDIESRLVRPDGRVVVVSSSAEAIVDAEGAVVGVRGLCVDRTARRAAEANAREAVVRADTARAELRAERQVVLQLQRALLPPTIPEVTGIELAVAYQPADSSAGVGGDFYDAFVLPGGELAIAVGDVVGHDVEAAVIMGRMRSAIRAYAVQDPAPDRVLRELNRLVCTSSDLAMASVFYGIYSSGCGRLEYANAGHPHPIVLSGGVARPMTHRHGIVVGVLPDADYLPHKVYLRPEDLLLCYTDGLIERPGTDLDSGLLGLCTAMTASGLPRRLHHLVPQLISSVAPEAGRDDICVLALRRV